MENKEKIESLLNCLNNVNGLIPFHKRCLKDLYARRIQILRELTDLNERKCYTCAYYDKSMCACYQDFTRAKPIFSEKEECDKWESLFTDSGDNGGAVYE